MLRATVLGLAAALVCASAGGTEAADPANYKILKLEGNNVRWHKPVSGQLPTSVSYSIVSGATEFAGARNCRKITNLDQLTVDSQLAMQNVRDEINAAFAMWQAAAGIAFREASDPATADILIGAQIEPEGWAFADVFYDTQSPETIKPISRSLICLNPQKRWKIGFDGDLKTYDLRYTLAHEIGHAIGLDHPVGSGVIMGYRYEERFRQLQPGDVQGAMILYGKPASTDIAAQSDRPEVKLPDPPEPSTGLGTRALNARSH